MTEDATAGGGISVRLRRASRTALVVAASGFLLNAALAGALLAPRLVSLRDLPDFMLRDGWQIALFCMGLLGGLLWLVGLVTGVAVLVAWRSGDRRPALAGLALSVATLTLIALPHWFGGYAPYLRMGLWAGGQPAYVHYGVHELPATECARLDALSPEAVVATYFETGDPSVKYWLENAERRRWWHETDVVLDMETLAGISDLRVAPDEPTYPREESPHAFRVSDAHTFQVTYTSRSMDGVGNPPGPRDCYVKVERTVAGVWRVSNIWSGG